METLISGILIFPTFICPCGFQAISISHFIQPATTLAVGKPQAQLSSDRATDRRHGASKGSCSAVSPRKPPWQQLLQTTAEKQYKQAGNARATLTGQRCHKASGEQLILAAKREKKKTRKCIPPNAHMTVGESFSLCRSLVGSSFSSLSGYSSSRFYNA